MTSGNARILLRGGMVVDGIVGVGRRADVAVEAGRITAVGNADERERWDVADSGAISVRQGDVVIDCQDRLVLPGLIDAHSHADAAVFDPAIALALLRQGVTTVITGQDGVSFAPGDGEYATEYFGAVNGRHPSYRGGGVAALLDTYDGTTAINVGYLVPHGTVRHEVMGSMDRPPSDGELARMCQLVATGLDEGALGLSTGLDYAPGYFAMTEELVAMARPVGRVAGLYVSHMRGGYEDNIAAGVAEVAAISAEAGVAAHISHLHGPAGLIATALDDRPDVDLSFDAYPYRRGCSLLAMPMLPPWLLRRGARAAAEALADPEVRDRVLREWIPVMAARPDMGPTWAATITVAGVGHPDLRWAEGRSLADAAAVAGVGPAEFGLDLIHRSGLAVSAVFKVPHQRAVTELATIFRHPLHLGSSDGIYVGGHPHPRGWGTFARYLGRYTRERGDFTFAEAAQHLSARTAARHGLADRGRIAAGSAADLIVVDPTSVADSADYHNPRALAVGIDDVLVNGVPVLAAGQPTGRTPGRGLRRNARAASLRSINLRATE